MSEQHEHEHDEDDAAPAEDETHADFEGSPEAEPEGVPAPEDDEQEPSASAAPTQAEMEARFKTLDRSATTWRNRVSQVLGETAQDLVPCELCGDGIPGFHWPVAVEEPRDEIHARLLAVLASPVEPQYRTATHVRACSECDGYGKVVSGSRVELNRLVQCPACKGSGFLGDAAPAVNGTGDMAPLLAVVAAVDEPPAPTDADLWGSPRLLGDGQENPNYGKMPQYKNPSLP